MLLPLILRFFALVVVGTRLFQLGYLCRHVVFKESKDVSVVGFGSIVDLHYNCNLQYLLITPGRCCGKLFKLHLMFCSRLSQCKTCVGLQEAVKCMRHSKRSTLTTDDVNSALSLRNVEVKNLAEIGSKF